MVREMQLWSTNKNMATWLQKVRLFRGVCSGDEAFTGPFHAMVDVTRRCNLQCIGCRFHSPVAAWPSVANRDNVADLSCNVLERLCRELREMRTRVLFLMGAGEPLLHPGLSRLIQTACGLGFRVSLLTNGTLLDEEKAAGLIESGLDTVQISLWGLTPEDCAKQYSGKSDVYACIVQGVKTLQRLKRKQGGNKPTVLLNHPINRENLSQLDRIIEVVRETGCDGILFAPFLLLRGRLQHLALSDAERTQLFQKLRGLKKELRTMGVSENVDRCVLRHQFQPNAQVPYPCHVGWYHVRLRLDGNVLPCGSCNLVMGNIHQQSLREIWNGPAYREFRKKASNRVGLAAMARENCDCTFCCYAEDNLRIDRIMRWFMRS